MKTRLDFITNSSSTGFMITNTSDEEKTIEDFAEEVQYLVDVWNTEYANSSYDLAVSHEEFLESAKDLRYKDIKWSPGHDLLCIFGDEQRTAIGRVLDYLLRDGGKTASFEWKFYDWYR